MIWQLTLYSIPMLLGGLIANATYFTDKRADAGDLLERLLPIKAVLGVALIIFSLLGMISSLQYFKVFFMWMLLMFILTNSLVLGIILAYEMIVNKFLSKNEAAKEKADCIIEKLTVWQSIIGWMNIAYGLLFFYFSLFANSIMKGILSQIMKGLN